MIKKITIILEVESDCEENLSENFIQKDLETELIAASNYYEIMDIHIE